LDKTHEQAWDKRNSPVRHRAVFGGNKGSISTDPNENDTIYPWPQYFEEEVETNTKNKSVEQPTENNTKWVLKYPGLPMIKEQTGADDYAEWPEVQFVEEYIKASIQIEEEDVVIPSGNESNTTNYLSPNTIEFPYKNKPYGNLSEISYLYEIIERIYLTTNYTQLPIVVKDVIVDMEFNNIYESAKDSPTINNLLKNYKFTFETYLDYLKLISNGGQGQYWTKYKLDEYNTPYIQNLIEKDFEIYNKSSETDITFKGYVVTKKIEKFLSDTNSNIVSFNTTYPFTDVNWLKTNMSEGVKITTIETANNTTQTLKVSPNNKSISSFVEPNSLFTSDNWKNNTKPSNNTISQVGLKDFYSDRTTDNMYITESYIDYGNNYSPSINKLIPKQTTSLLNTPYFVNAIMKGVNDEKSNTTTNPYVELGYLFVNSLPIITTKEKIKDMGGNPLNYLSSTLNKFSAIHKLPYLWVLKYGSIWYRYKEDKTNNVDILSSVWTDFNYTLAYDPTNGNTSTTYPILIDTNQPYNFTLRTQQPSLITCENGFYPKLVNDVYYYFTKKEIFTGYTQNDFTDAYSKGLRISKNSTNTTIDNLSVNNWFQYINTFDNSDFEGTTDVVVIPSAGNLRFNQPEFEFLNADGTLTQSLDNNPSVYNGTARCLWEAPNYGYFNNSTIHMPKTTEYLKIINTSTDNQDSFNLINNGNTLRYSPIEEIFSIFTKEMLDEFEKHFLEFCNPKSSGTNKVVNLTLMDMMKQLLFVPDDSFGDSGNQIADKLSKKQLENFVSKMTNTLSGENDIILKIGNPGKFNRKIFNAFIRKDKFNKDSNINFGNYIPNTLPTNGGQVTLQSSINANPTAWQAMYLYVGEYENQNLIYSNNGSYLTDFFIDFDIEFNEENVKNLSQIIKMYGSSKLQGDDKDSFLTKFKNNLTTLQTNQKSVADTLFTKLNSKLQYYNEIPTNTQPSAIDDEVNSTALYYSFKALNDKWVSGQDFKNRTVFEDFLFLDRANADVGDKIIVNIDKLRGVLKNDNGKVSVYGLLGSIIEQNGFVFMPVPTYTNFYGTNIPSKNPTPKSIDIAKAVFGTHMLVDTIDSRPKFLCIYVGLPSHYADIYGNGSNQYKTDSFMVSSTDRNPILRSENEENMPKTNKAVAFGVDFGIRGQGIFKGINIDMDQKRNTAPTFQILQDLGQQASGQPVSQQSMSLYNYYQTMSFVCSVSSMGNAMIQPTMYFELRHVPIFNGTYLIINVSHTITNREFNTQFEGVRIPIYTFQEEDKLVTSVNRSLVKSYRTKLKQKQT
jgi:hypothetical protein